MAAVKARLPALRVGLRITEFPESVSFSGNEVVSKGRKGFVNG